MKGSWYKVQSAGTLMYPCNSDNPMLYGTRTYSDVGTHHLLLWQQDSLYLPYTSNLMQSVKGKNCNFLNVGNFYII